MEAALTQPDRQLDSILAGRDINVLQPDDVPRLRISWISRYGFRDVLSLTEQHPGLSVWHRRSGEYLIGMPWRHRAEIATIAELASARWARHLVEAFTESAKQRELSLVLVSEYIESRPESFYRSVGMSLMESIIVYELDAPKTAPEVSPVLRFEVLDLQDEHSVSALMELDRDAFPWLWWNSREEFSDYFHAPGVKIWLGWTDDNELGAYVGTTSLRSWGHLDRIAVAPRFQGSGFGRKALDQAIISLMAEGAKKIALSTQASNTVSRSLYESYGFKRSPKHDYKIWGRWLNEDQNTLK